jgi:DNA-binding NarL/FixJ family response regulator
MPPAIRVLIADDETVLRGALADLIRSDPDFELVGATSDAEETIEVAGTTHPDVALVDVRMPRGGGLRVAEELRSRATKIRVLAHTAADDRSTVVRMLQARSGPSSRARRRARSSPRSSGRRSGCPACRPR